MKHRNRHSHFRSLFSLFRSLALAATVAVAVAEAPLIQPVSFSFDDQHQNAMVLKPEFRKPMIVTVADKKGSEQLLQWVEPLTREFGDRVDFFPIADLRKVPGPLKGLIRRSFRKQFEYNVAMDWEGTAVRQLGAQPDSANLFLLNRKGKVVQTVRGAASEENLAAMVQAIHAELARQGDDTFGNEPDHHSP